MAYKIADTCISCGACEAECPSNAISEGEGLDVIDPDLCIDCGACVGECPVQAIYPDGDVPAKWQQYVALNKTKAPSLPPRLSAPYAHSRTYVLTTAIPTLEE